MSTGSCRRAIRKFLYFPAFNGFVFAFFRLDELPWLRLRWVRLCKFPCPSPALFEQPRNGFVFAHSASAMLRDMPRPESQTNTCQVRGGFVYAFSHVQDGTIMMISGAYSGATNPMIAQFDPWCFLRDFFAR
jgi:hypothetical protein